MSYDINNTILVGRLTRDPEISYTKSNLAVCKFSIANARGGSKDNEEVNFFNITVWDKMATSCGKYLKKGSQCIVQGRLKQDRWQDENQQNRSSVGVVASSVQFIGSKAENGGSSANNNQQGNVSMPENANKPMGNQDFDNEGFENFEVPIDPDLSSF